MRTKKVLAAILALITLFSCMSTTAFAESTTTTIKYLEPTYKNSDYTQGISGWTVVEKENVEVATAATDFSAGGWYAVTSDVTINSNVTVNGDLNLYIAKGVTLNFGIKFFNAAGHTVTLYGGGTFKIGEEESQCGKLTVGKLIDNGAVLQIIGYSAYGMNNSGDAGEAGIIGDALLNDGSGYIMGGSGDIIESGTGGAGGNCVSGSLHINGGSFNIDVGEGGDYLYEGSKGANGAVAENFSYNNVKIPSCFNHAELTELEMGYGDDNTLVSQKTSYLIPDNTDTTKGTLTGGSAAKGGKVTATYTTTDGNLVSKLYADGVEIAATKGVYEYTMPAHNVILTADYVSGCYLDLESSATYLDSRNITQTYTLTQTGDTTYVDVTKVKVTWTLPEISASYQLTKTWSPDKMEWVDSKTTAEIGEKTATFTFTNYSSVKVCAELTFTKAIGSDSGAATVGAQVLDTLVNDDHTMKSGSVANGVTFTHKYTPTASDFNSLADGTGTYGTYTATIKSVCKVTFDMNEHGNAIDAQYVGSGGKVTAPTNPSADGFTFGGWYENAECTGDAWNFTTGTVSADKTLYAKWTENV